jgi:hypothetical protein
LVNILDLAQESGLFVTLDGTIGRERYQSVHGSVTALKRFADAIKAEAQNELLDDRCDLAHCGEGDRNRRTG